MRGIERRRMSSPRDYLTGSRRSRSRGSLRGRRSRGRPTAPWCERPRSASSSNTTPHHQTTIESRRPTQQGRAAARGGSRGRRGGIIRRRSGVESRRRRAELWRARVSLGCTREGGEASRRQGVEGGYPGIYDSENSYDGCGWQQPVRQQRRRRRPSTAGRRWRRSHTRERWA
jgi:hypothetical protein